MRHYENKLIVATKIAVPGRNFYGLGDGKQAIDRKNIEQAVNDSLKRLQTDYIHLYQIHWTDRSLPQFGETIFNPSTEGSRSFVSLTINN